MKISIFTHYTNPEKRNDPWKESLSCYESFADEVIVVGENWPQNFKWDYIGKVFQEGFNKSKGDWVINMPIDMMFHEKDFSKIRNFLLKNNDEPAVGFPKYKFFTFDRYEIKSIDCLAMNKKKFRNIMLNGGSDLCLPTLDGKEIKPKSVPTIKVPIWNYDTTFRTKEIISADRLRFAKAWFAYFNEWNDRGGPTESEAFLAWFEMIKLRFPKHIFNKKIEAHPKFIQEKLKSLSPEQFGYDLFGLKNEISSSIKDYINGYKTKFHVLF